MSERQYIRFKRENKTYFIPCFPMDRIESIKTKLQEFLEIDPIDMRLYLGNRLIDEKSTVHDQDLQNDCLVRIILKKPGMGGQEWETVEEDKLMTGDNSPVKF